MTETQSSAENSTVIIGAGLAGAKAAEGLRENGYAGSITLLSAEQHLPYERPALSKEFMAESQSLADFTVHERSWYSDHQVSVRLGVEATSIDTTAQAVSLSDGSAVTYSTLILATGSRAIKPPIAGSDSPGVFYLRTIDDAQRLRDILTDGARLAVIGGGWIGLEVAAAARTRGASVTVIEAAEQPLQGPLGVELGARFAALHRKNGVDVRVGTSVESITMVDGKATGIALTDGSAVDADAVLVAVGAQANIGLAEDAGLATGYGGVLVDAGMRTSTANVYAVGDIAAAEHPLLGGRVRTEHWANALNQPSVAAQNVCGAKAQFDRLPYFFTDQYDLGMEFSGMTTGYSDVIYRGDIDGLEFIAFWVDETGMVLAGMNVNIWDSTDDIKALISARKPVDTTKLTDTAVPLADLLD